MGAGNPVTLCDLGIFVDQAAEPISPQNPDISAWGWCVRRSGGRILVECPVRPAGVVMVGVLAQDQPQVPFAGDQHPVQALAAAPPTQRSAIAFARGARIGVLMIRTPIAVNTASNAAVNLASRSRITNFSPSP